MPRPRKGPTEDEWSHHKAVIQKRYIHDRISLKVLASELIDRGLLVTSKQLEHQLQRWGLRRNMNEQAWKYVDHKIKKRQRDGKSSMVVLCGRVLEPPTVQKETYRNCIPSASSCLLDAPSPTSPPHLSLSVCTPPPLSHTSGWPPNLPWLVFQRQYLDLLAPNLISFHLQHNKNLGPVNIHHSIPVERFDRSIISNRFGGAGTIANLASALDRVIPESFPGEHIHSAEIVQSGSASEVFQLWAKLLLFQMSNEFDSALDENNWETLATLIELSGILRSPLDLRTLDNPSMAAIMEKIFVASIQHHLLRANMLAWEIVQWLLKSGYDPNITFSHPFFGTYTTPIQFACEYSTDQLLVSLLLAKGADPNALPESGSATALQLATLRIKRDCNPSLALVKELISFGAIIEHPRSSPSSAILTAIDGGNVDLIDFLILSSADPNMLYMTKNFAWKDEWELFHDSIFTRCASHTCYISKDVGCATAIQLFKHMLEKIKAFPPCIRAEDLIGPEVPIAAVRSGNIEFVRFLSTIMPGGLDLQTKFGLTALHSAVNEGKRDICEFLLKSGVSPISSSRHIPPPLHIACFRRDVEIAKLLVEYGAILEQEWEWNTAYCKLLRRGRGLRNRARITPFHCALMEYHTAKRTLVPFLLEAGARPPHNGLHLAIRFDFQLFRLLLDTNLDLNSRDDKGMTAFQYAIARGPEYNSRAIEWDQKIGLLLLHGAKIPAGAVVAAARWAQSPSHLVLEFLKNGLSLADQASNGERGIETVLAMSEPASEALQDAIYSYLLTVYRPELLCAAIQGAGKTGFYDWVELLLYNRPTIIENEEDLRLEGTAIAIAMRYENRPLVNLLLSYLPKATIAMIPTCHVVDTPIIFPVSRDGEFICKCYSRRRLAPSAKIWRGHKHILGSPITAAVLTSNVGYVQKLISDGFYIDRLALAAAVYKSSLEMVKLCISALGNLTISDNISITTDSIWWAVYFGNIEKLDLLIDAAPNLHNDWYRHRPVGRSYLQCAVERENMDIVARLLNAGADVNEPPAINMGATSLQLAAINGDLGMSRLLMDRGADINARGALRGGRTALEGAAEHGRIDMIQLLLDRGAQVTGGMGSQYRRAVLFASRLGYRAAAEIVKQSGSWEPEDESWLKENQFIEVISDYDPEDSDPEDNEIGYIKE